MTKTSTKEAEPQETAATQPIYLDYNATTPLDPRVLEAMMPYLTEVFGNPSSRTHEYGHAAKQAVDKARETVANCIKARSETEIVFTSGATESNNLALRGVMNAMKAQGKNHLITSPVEHKAILDTAEALKRDGFEISYCSVRSNGTIVPEEIKKLITPKTALISIMHANNEIGTIYPVAEIGEIAKEAGVFFHVDAAQSLGKIPVDVKKMNIHLLSMSAHKFYGPKGIGALYVCKHNPRVKIQAVQTGGGHESGMRSGTLPTHQIVGLAEALKLSIKEMPKESKRLTVLRDELLETLKKEIPDLHVNGTIEDRLPNNLNVSIPGVDSEALMMSLRDKLAFSNGSACTSADWKASYVLEALGLDDSLSDGAIRLGLGKNTEKRHLSLISSSIGEVIRELRELSY